tara:strand:+ start:287 stop:1111 length:825 start_codon:yes stop_codon:yes gene_type:complete
MMKQLGVSGQVFEEALVRHMVLNSIRAYKNKFSKEYGEMVICCDDRNYWRKDVFPYYKGHRKKDREKSSIDWVMVFEALNRIREELKEFFPYKVVQVERAEADDVIGVLATRNGTWLNNESTERILVLSGDKDFGQLQKFTNVDQYSPVLKKWIRINDARRFLREHIMRGDRGDGIPNFLSSDSCLMTGERQKPIQSKKIDDWVDKEPEQFCNDVMLRNYRRNEQLVDLDQIPAEIVSKINEAYDTYEVPKRRGLLNYFIKYKLKNLVEHIGEF